MGEAISSLHIDMSWRIALKIAKHYIHSNTVKSVKILTFGVVSTQNKIQVCQGTQYIRWLECLVWPVLLEQKYNI